MKFKLILILVFASITAFAQGKLDYSFLIDRTSYVVFETHNSAKALNDTAYFDLYRLGNDKKIAREIKYVVNKKTQDTLKSGFYNVNYNNMLFYLEGKKRPALERKYTQKNVNEKVILVPKTSYLQIIPDMDDKPIYELENGTVKVEEIGIKDAYYSPPKAVAPRDNAPDKDKIDVEAEFPGGTKALWAFIGKNLEYPKEASKNNISGKVMVRFTVEADGSITKINVERKLGYGCDEEVIRVLKKMPKWKPARAKCKAVSSSIFIPIHFAIE